MNTTIRVFVATASGSQYAFWWHPEGGWWLRARAIATPRARPILDGWLRIDAPSPWPPVLRVPLGFWWNKAAIMSEEHPGIELGCRYTWRVTSDVVAIDLWSPSDEWPREPVVSRGRTET